MYWWTCDSTFNKHDKNFPKSVEQHCPTWLHEGNTQGSPPTTQILKSLTYGKDFEGASIHVCKLAVIAGNNPSFIGPHISSNVVACTQGAHCFQWLLAYQSIMKCLMDGTALKQTNPLCYQHEISRFFLANNNTY
jgi:hypothetical protein